jgi:predicted RNA binding protein YcfA (HicA-like mRNA interferase family)
MTKREKRLQKMRRNPRGVRFSELRQVLEDHGFKLARVSGSHHTFRAEIRGRVWTQTLPRKILSVYVKQVLKSIDEIAAWEEQIKGDNDE